MKNMHLLNTDTKACLTVGFFQSSDTSSIMFAVFKRDVAESEVGWVADSGNTEFAERITGWYRTYGGPGKRFTSEPELRVYGKKLLVIQVVGLDV